MFEAEQNLKGPGRPKFRRNTRTMDLELLQRIASETLADGRLLMTPERVGFALAIDQATVRSLLESGELPTVYVGHRGSPRVPAEDVLALVRRQSTHSMVAT